MNKITHNPIPISQKKKKHTSISRFSHTTFSAFDKYTKLVNMVIDTKVQPPPQPIYITPHFLQIIESHQAAKSPLLQDEYLLIVEKETINH